jgi:FKBP12-rapamycin complex-associated protein
VPAPPSCLASTHFRLLVRFGAAQDANAALWDGFAAVPIDTWLHVIPQLIARIHTKQPKVAIIVTTLSSSS